MVYRSNSSTHLSSNDINNVLPIPTVNHKSSSFTNLTLPPPSAATTDFDPAKQQNRRSVRRLSIDIERLRLKKDVTTLCTAKRRNSVCRSASDLTKSGLYEDLKSLKTQRNECVQKQKSDKIAVPCATTSTKVSSTIPTNARKFPSWLNEGAAEPDVELEDKHLNRLQISVPLNRLPVKTVDLLMALKNSQTNDKLKILCLYCDRTFSSQTLYAKHSERVHQAPEGRRLSARNSNSSSLLYPGCSHCHNGKTTSLLNEELPALFHHLVDIHFDKYFACKPCTVRFPSKEALQTHSDQLHKDTTQKSPTDKRKKRIERGVPDNVPENFCQPLTIQVDIAENFDDKKDDDDKSSPDEPILRSSRRQQANRSTDSAKTTSPRKTRMLRNEETILSRLGITQNRSPRTRRGLKPRSEQMRAETPVIRPSRSKNSRATSNSVGMLAEGAEIATRSSTITKVETLSSTFDENFYESVSSNVRQNLSCHLDGKMQSGPMSPSPISPVDPVPTVRSTLVRSPLVSDTEIHEATAISALTAFPTLLTASQYGAEPMSGGKIKKPITKNSWKWKWDCVKKYKWVNEGGKVVKKIKQPVAGIRDLSKLDMWTQLTMRTKHEVVRKQELEVSGEEQCLAVGEAAREDKRKLITQLNTILDTRILPQINLEQNDQRVVKLEKEDTNANASHNETPQPEDEQRNDDLLTILQIAKRPAGASASEEDKVLSGEWARPRCYICYGCGEKFENIRRLEDHKNNFHPNVYSTHYEIVGRELIAGDLFRHFYIPSTALRGHSERNGQLERKTNVEIEDSMDSVTSFSLSCSKSDSFDTDSNSRNSKVSAISAVASSVGHADETSTNDGSNENKKLCTKCSRSYNTLSELYRHMLDCSGDYDWFLAKKRHNIKYRYFGSRRRKINRANFGNRRPIRPKKEESDTPRIRDTQTPKPRPSDAESIQRMLENLPAKRVCRQIFPNLQAKKRARKFMPTNTLTRNRQHLKPTNTKTNRNFKFIASTQTAVNAIRKNISRRLRYFAANNSNEMARSTRSARAVAIKQENDEETSEVEAKGRGVVKTIARRAQKLFRRPLQKRNLRNAASVKTDNASSSSIMERMRKSKRVQVTLKKLDDNIVDLVKLEVKTVVDEPAADVAEAVPASKRTVKGLMKTIRGRRNAVKKAVESDEAEVVVDTPSSDVKIEEVEAKPVEEVQEAPIQIDETSQSSSRSSSSRKSKRNALKKQASTETTVEIVPPSVNVVEETPTPTIVEPEPSVPSAETQIENVAPTVELDEPMDLSQSKAKLSIPVVVPEPIKTPPMKRRTRKLNDCIAMLTGKLQEKLGVPFISSETSILLSPTKSESCAVSEPQPTQNRPLQVDESTSVQRPNKEPSCSQSAPIAQQPLEKPSQGAPTEQPSEAPSSNHSTPTEPPPVSTPTEQPTETPKSSDSTPTEPKSSDSTPTLQPIETPSSSHSTPTKRKGRRDRLTNVHNVIETIETKEPPTVNDTEKVVLEPVPAIVKAPAEEEPKTVALDAASASEPIVISPTIEETTLSTASPKRDASKTPQPDHKTDDAEAIDEVVQPSDDNKINSLVDKVAIETIDRTETKALKRKDSKKKNLQDATITVDVLEPPVMEESSVDPAPKKRETKKSSTTKAAGEKSPAPSTTTVVVAEAKEIVSEEVVEATPTNLESDVVEEKQIVPGAVIEAAIKPKPTKGKKHLQSEKQIVPEGVTEVAGKAKPTKGKTISESDVIEETPPVAEEVVQATSRQKPKKEKKQLQSDVAKEKQIVVEEISATSKPKPTKGKKQLQSDVVEEQVYDATSKPKPAKGKKHLQSDVVEEKQIASEERIDVPSKPKPAKGKKRLQSDVVEEKPTVAEEVIEATSKPKPAKGRKRAQSDVVKEKQIVSVETIEVASKPKPTKGKKSSESGSVEEKQTVSAEVAEEKEIVPEEVVEATNKPKPAKGKKHLQSDVAEEKHIVSEGLIEATSKAKPAKGKKHLQGEEKQIVSEELVEATSKPKPAKGKKDLQSDVVEDKQIVPEEVIEATSKAKPAKGKRQSESHVVVPEEVIEATSKPKSAKGKKNSQSNVVEEKHIAPAAPSKPKPTKGKKHSVNVTVSTAKQIEENDENDADSVPLIELTKKFPSVETVDKPIAEEKDVKKGKKTKKKSLTTESKVSQVVTPSPRVDKSKSKNLDLSDDEMHPWDPEIGFIAANNPEPACTPATETTSTTPDTKDNNTPDPSSSSSTTEPINEIPIVPTAEVTVDKLATKKKRRKNELAKIIADQLLESFKEVDKSRIEELKLLHDLSIESNDDLLLSTTMSRTPPPKRRTASNIRSDTAVDTASADAANAANENVEKASPKRKKMSESKKPTPSAKIVKKKKTATPKSNKKDNKKKSDDVAGGYLSDTEVCQPKKSVVMRRRLTICDESPKRMSRNSKETEVHVSLFDTFRKRKNINELPTKQTLKVTKPEPPSKEVKRKNKRNLADNNLSKTVASDVEPLVAESVIDTTAVATTTTDKREDDGAGKASNVNDLVTQIINDFTTSTLNSPTTSPILFGDLSKPRLNNTAAKLSSVLSNKKNILNGESLTNGFKSDVSKEITFATLSQPLKDKTVEQIRNTESSSSSSDAAKQPFRAPFMSPRWDPADEWNGTSKQQLKDPTLHKLWTLNNKDEQLSGEKSLYQSVKEKTKKFLGKISRKKARKHDGTLNNKKSTTTVVGHKRPLLRPSILSVSNHTAKVMDPVESETCLKKFESNSLFLGKISNFENDSTSNIFRNDKMGATSSDKVDSTEMAAESELFSKKSDIETTIQSNLKSNFEKDDWKVDKKFDDQPTKRTNAKSDCNLSVPVANRDQLPKRNSKKKQKIVAAAAATNAADDPPKTDNVEKVPVESKRRKMGSKRKPIDVVPATIATTTASKPLDESSQDTILSEIVTKIRDSNTEQATDSDEDLCLAEVAKNLHNKVKSSDDVGNDVATAPVELTESFVEKTDPGALHDQTTLTALNDESESKSDEKTLDATNCDEDDAELNNDTNTDLIDMDLEDSASVCTSSMDTTVTSSGGSQKRRKRRHGRSILMKSNRKAKRSDGSFLAPGESYFCDLCAKSFRTQGGLATHRTTLTHISKLSEQEFKQKMEASSDIVVAESPKPVAEEDVTTKPDVTMSPVIESSSQPHIPFAQSPSTTNQLLHSSSAVTSPVRNQSLTYLNNIEPISSPEHQEFNYDRYGTNSRQPRSNIPIHDSTRIALSQEQRFFYECCSMLKGSDRSSVVPNPSDSPSKYYTLPERSDVITKPVTPRSNEQYSYVVPEGSKHSKGIPKIDLNQFSDISSDSNPAFSCPQNPSSSETQNNFPIESKRSGIDGEKRDYHSSDRDFDSMKKDERRPISDRTTILDAEYLETYSDMGDSFPSSQDVSESEQYTQTILERSSHSVGLIRGGYRDNSSSGAIYGKPFDDNKKRRNVFTIAVDNNEAKGFSNGSPIESPLHSTSSQSSTLSKPRTKAAMKGYDNFKISIPTTGIDLQQALNRSPNASGCKLAALADIALRNDVPDVVALMRSQSDVVEPSHIPLEPSPRQIEEEEEELPAAAVEVSHKPQAPKKSNKSGGLNSRKKKVVKTPKKCNKVKVSPKSAPKNQPKDVFDFDDFDDSTDAPILPMSQVRSKAVPPPADDDENSESSSYSDRLDYNYGSMSESDTSVDNLQKKCLIERIFKSVKKTDAKEKEKVEPKKPPLPKQELDKLFDGLRQTDKNAKSDDKKPAATEKNSSANTNKDKQSDGKVKTDRSRDRRSKKSREIANLEEEWGMSMNQIVELIGVGQRKTQRRCAVNKQKTFAENWSSDEYEDFHATKDIFALIHEAEMKAGRARSRTARSNAKRERQQENDKNEQSEEAKSKAVAKVDAKDKENKATTDDKSDFIKETTPAIAESKKPPEPSRRSHSKSTDSKSPAKKPSAKVKRSGSFAATESDDSEFNLKKSTPAVKTPSKIKDRRQTISSRRELHKTPKTNGARVKQNRSVDSRDFKTEGKTKSKPMARRKRKASEMLYYWSSSSDEDFGRIKPRDDNFDDDNLEQHGWIVGDSHKKLVTLLAHAKGKKIEDCAVKKAIHKKKS